VSESSRHGEDNVKKTILSLMGIAAATMLTSSAAAQYAGLYITEIISQPTENELIEVFNSTNAPMDVSGVVVADEDNNNTEGAVKFPAGTTIPARGVVIIAVNNSANEPTYLDSLPNGTVVFYDPARNVAGWTPVGGVTLVAMTDFATVDGGTSSGIALSGDDNVTLYRPTATFAASVGVNDNTLAIDGMNYGPGSTYSPINSTGATDTSGTRVGASQPAAGNSLQRVAPAATNVASNAAFVEAAATPAGTIGVSNVSDWTAY